MEYISIVTFAYELLICFNSQIDILNYKWYIENEVKLTYPLR